MADVVCGQGIRRCKYRIVIWKYATEDFGSLKFEITSFSNIINLIQFHTPYLLDNHTVKLTLYQYNSGFS
jgi:hypothetical protein